LALLSTDNKTNRTLTVKMKRIPGLEAVELLLGAKERTKCLDLAFKLRTADLPLVTISLHFLQLSFETRHLVNALLPIAASCKSVGFALLDLGRRFSGWTAFGRGCQSGVWRLFR